MRIVEEERTGSDLLEKKSFVELVDCTVGTVDIVVHDSAYTVAENLGDLLLMVLVGWKIDLASKKSWDGSLTLDYMFD